MSDIRVPHNLRQYVVEQDYEQYTEVDQAVWRFVLLQTYERLRHTAHPAYRAGLSQAGISVERIPRVTEMSACLERFGWQAVCVDGFIPPRAFQEFQAASILPIAAEIRSREHLTYTPAPDIVHEAAGHAPILPDPRYAAYLRAIGEVGKKAFSSPEDTRVYAAIFQLSEVKELRGAAPSLLRAAELELEQALAAVSFTSEASRLSRLYWWTAEYGLVGTVSDYRLYGAGLLSSLWESHFCHDARIRKLPLSAACADQDYDITRPQPQLYVARDFEQLFSVLAEVDASLAHRIGGERALTAALRSGEVATLHVGNGRFITGELSSVSGGANTGVLGFRGRVGLGVAGQLRHIVEGTQFRLPIGPLAGGAELAPRLVQLGSRYTLNFESGACFEGTLAASELDAEGRLCVARFADYRFSCERAGFSEQGAEYVLLVATQVVTAHAGASDPAFHPSSEASRLRVPKPRDPDARERALLRLYERAVSAFREQLGSDAVRVFADVHIQLTHAFPDEWLLRWNLLECLCKLGESGALSRTLENELLLLELKFQQKEPIASGLRYLAARAAR